MKKIFLFIIMLFVLTGCDKTKENSAPVLTGIGNIDALEGSTVDLLNGVLAYDEEDGDITPKITFTTNAKATITDGYAIFHETGSFRVIYEVIDNGGKTASKGCDVIVTARDVYYDFKNTASFNVKATGHTVLTLAGMVNGQYQIEASGCEVSEDLSLNRVYTVTPRSNYIFNYYLSSKSSGQGVFLVNNKIAQKVMINEGSNVLSLTVNANENTELSISLLLGALGDKIEITLDTVKYAISNATGKIELLNDYNFYGRFHHEGRGSFTDHTLHVTEASEETWMSGVFVDTKIVLEKDKTYYLSFNLTMANDNPVTIWVQNKQWDETVYLKAETTGNSYHFTASLTLDDLPEEHGLWFYIQSGKYINDVTISELSVKADAMQTEIKLDDFYNENPGFDCTLETMPGGFKYFIPTFGNVDYEQKVSSPVFYLSGSSINYVLTFKARATSPVRVVCAAPIAGGWDPTWFWQSFVIDTNEKVYTISGYDAGSDRDNFIVWQFGSSENKRYSDVTIEIYDIKIAYKNSNFDGE